MTIHPVLLCGSASADLWPLSRKNYPTQFAAITDAESAFQAIIRCLSGPGYAAPSVVTAEPYRFIVRDQLAAVGVAAEATLIAPGSEDGAASMLAAALWFCESDPSAMLLITPTNYILRDTDMFLAALGTARCRAERGEIVLLGIEASTGSRDGAEIVAFDDWRNARRTPTRKLTPTGIVLCRAGALRDAYTREAPELFSSIRQALRGASRKDGVIRLDSQRWPRPPNGAPGTAISAPKALGPVLPWPGDWSEITWSTLWQNADRDPDGTATIGKATAIGCTDTLLRSESPHVEIVGLGLTDIIAVATPDAVLVAHKSDSGRIAEAIASLSARRAPQAAEAPVDHRAWGWRESLVKDTRFQVKRIVVKPGAALALRNHEQRSEHWIVLAGAARVTIGDHVQPLAENQAIHVPLGATHRVENTGRFPLMLIQVQTGAYIDEEDMIESEVV